MLKEYPSHHFSIMLSPGVMEKQTILFIKSLNELYNHNLNYRITLLILENEKITNPLLLKYGNVNIVEYKCNPIFKFPWSVYPRWNIDSDKELIIGVDTDVVVCKNYLDNLLHYRNFNISGRIAIENHLDMKTWERLFKKCNTKWPTKIYKYLQGEDGPLYINNGLVILQSKCAKEMRECSQYILKKINEDVYNSLYITQIATTIAIHKIGLTYSIMDENFHQLSKINNQINDKTVFYHYFSHRDHPPQIPLAKFL